jgi:hypothetical protein
MIRLPVSAALLLAAVAAVPACSSGHNVPDMDERAAVPRTTPIPPPPVGTISPRPSALPRDQEARAVTAQPGAQETMEVPGTPPLAAPGAETGAQVPVQPGAAGPATPQAPPAAGQTAPAQPAPAPPAGEHDDHAGHSPD